MKNESMLTEFTKEARALIFPDRCALCGSIIKRGEAVCKSCKDTEYLISGTRCFKCGLSQKECQCKNRSNFYDAIASVFVYEGIVKAGIKRWKYAGAYQSKNYFADMIASTVNDAFGDIKFDAVTFVPQTEHEKEKRGFNQCEILARETAERLNIPLVPTLFKLIDTNCQHDIDFLKKSGNIFGVFDCIEPNKIKGQTLLLIDDVKTSGATINECAKMLQLYEAQHVYVAVIAVTKRKDNHTKQ